MTSNSLIMIMIIKKKKMATCILT